MIRFQNQYRWQNVHLIPPLFPKRQKQLCNGSAKLSSFSLMCFLIAQKSFQSIMELTKIRRIYGLYSQSMETVLETGKYLYKWYQHVEF